MKRFAKLFNELDTSTSTRSKVDALKRYFAAADPADAAWAVYFLAGGKPRQAVNSRVLRDFALGASGLPEWLFEESYQAVGDQAETVALLLPPPTRASDGSLAWWIEERLLPLRGRAPADVVAALREYVAELETPERFLLMKLIGGGFRVGVSRLLVTRALAEHAQERAAWPPEGVLAPAGRNSAQREGCIYVDPKLVAQRMIGYTDDTRAPSAERYLSLLGSDTAAVVDGQPYPFFLAHSLNLPIERFNAELGASTDWLVEWKYDGIRAQLVKRGGNVWLWSRGEELMTDRFPEIAERAKSLPDGTVLDGEILVWHDGAPQPFGLLQKRVTRKSVTPQILQQAPAIFLAYDVLQLGGEDMRARQQRDRRAALLSLAQEHAVELSPQVEAESWEALAQLRSESRERGVEGFMLKHLDSTYRIGRTKDANANWWKWKIDPYTVDAVLVYAQRGHGRRASLYSDYTFAVWDNDASAAERALVPFTKAFSGLTDEEIRKVDEAIRRTTIEKFGPVRSVT
ncbi:MAG: ATP-dependent DNA ligase, partial [Burkholderiaceae bacterium]